MNGPVDNPNPYVPPTDPAGDSLNLDAPSLLRLVVTGAVWSLVSVIPITASLALFFRVPVPSDGIDGGLSHVVPAMLALLFYGVAMGGFILVGIGGALAGLAAWFSTSTARKRRRIQRCLSAGVTFVVLFVRAGGGIAQIAPSSDITIGSGNIVALDFAPQASTLFAGTSYRWLAASKDRPRRIGQNAGAISATRISDGEELRHLESGCPTAIAASLARDEIYVAAGRYHGPRPRDYTSGVPRGYGPGGVRILDPVSLETVHSFGTRGAVFSLQVLESRGQLAALTADPSGRNLELYLWNLGTREVVATMNLEGTPPPLEWGLPIKMLATTADEDTLIISTSGSAENEADVDEGGELLVLSLKTHDVVRRLRFRRGHILFIDISPTGNSIAFCASGSGYVVEWPANDLSDAISLPSPPMASAMFFNQSGTRLIRVAGATDRTGRKRFMGDVLGFCGGKVISIAQLNGSPAIGNIFSATRNSGRTEIAVGGADGKIVTWEIPD